MTKQECAIVTAHTEISMLRGDDLKYLYRYLSEIIGRPVFSHEIAEVCEQFRDRIKADFIALCRNASDDNEPEVRHGRWIPTKLKGYYECSACRYEHTSNPAQRFCSYCGARMDGATDVAGHCGAMMDGGTISRERFAEIMGEDEQS